MDYLLSDVLNGALIALPFMAGLFGICLLAAFIFRRVVPTNMVHIIQSAGTTKSYGSSTDNGNVYYEWPAWLPFIGVTSIELPVSNFKLDLDDYQAYDVDRVPFSVDVTAFFRVSNTNTAAERVESFEELKDQLYTIMEGAVRTVLAGHNIDKIMLNRSTFGEAFTDEVEEQLGAWGVVPVKQMELMDIRDAGGSKVIQNIMAKKQSFIEMESRKEVADNRKKADIAEIEAKRETEMSQQQAQQAVGERTAEKNKAINVANEKEAQITNEQRKITKEKEMEIVKVEQVKKAEIAKQQQVIKAQEDKETTVLRAEGQLTEEQKKAAGILANGQAEAESKKLMELAQVQAQITLAEKISNDEGYQKYLVTIRQVEANEKIGIEQAKALHQADVKVISNAGNVSEGVTGVMDLFTSKGGTSLAGMLEGLAQSDLGKDVISKVTGKNKEGK